ncbi:Serpin B11 [Halotydeus destructor]|nr:Serpin B11 [Halotydeus destructor]
MTRLIVLVTTLLLIVSIVNGKKKNRQEEQAKRVRLNQAHIQFSLDLLATLLIDNFSPETKLIHSFGFSPLSVQSTLMMVQLGARGHTYDEIANALYLSQWADSRNAIAHAHDIYGQSLKSLVDDETLNGSLLIANQLFVQKDLIPSSDFETELRKHHMARLRPVDFSLPETVATVNDFVEGTTKGIIKDFISSAPSPDALLMAVNALYYKGDWQYKFNPLDTTDERFQLTNGKSVALPMMVGKMPIAFAYSETLNTTVIELPYRSQRLGLFLLLPDQVSGVFSLMRSLNVSSFTSLIGSMRKQTGPEGVNVRLPRFEITSTPRMTKILQNSLGIHSLFTSGEADLSGMFLNSPGVAYVEEFLHKVVFKVDEKGSVGAAASATIVERIGSFGGSYFEADHPFMYFLIDKHTGLVLFSGIYAGPSAA